MELCIHGGVISDLPKHRLFSTKPYFFHSKTSLICKNTTVSHRNSGLHYFASLLRAKTNERDVFSINELFEELSDGAITMDEDPIAKQSVLNETKPAEEIANEDPLMNELALEFLEMFNVKENSEDTYSILVYGSSALVGLWLASAVIGALDSIPVIPKVLELVGLAFAVWFSSRYLILKKNRDELSTKIKDLKQQVTGSRDD